MRGSVLLVFSSKSCFLKIHQSAAWRIRQLPELASSATFSFLRFIANVGRKIPQRQDAKLTGGPPARCPRGSSGRMAREQPGASPRRQNASVSNKKGEEASRRRAPRGVASPSAEGHARTHVVRELLGAELQVRTRADVKK